MRVRAAILVVLLTLTSAACGDDNGGGETEAGSATVTETVTTPAPEVAAPQATAPESAPTTPEAPGEVVVLRGAAGGAQTGPQFSSFMLVPDSGDEPVTIAAANDLDLPIDVRRDLFDPRCEGKLQGGFTVEPAREGETEFQYALISVELTANAC